MKIMIFFSITSALSYNSTPGKSEPKTKGKSPVVSLSGTLPVLFYVRALYHEAFTNIVEVFSRKDCKCPLRQLDSDTPLNFLSAHLATQASGKGYFGKCV